MKNKFLLLTIASLALISTQASASTAQSDDVIKLPTYLVESPRYLPAEKSIEASLSELRDQVSTPVVTVELYSLRSQATSAFTGCEVKTAQQVPAAAIAVATG